jgi:hypothetical protein
VISIVLLFLATMIWFGVIVFSTIYDGLAPDVFSLIVFVLIAGLILYRWLSSVRGYTILWGADGPAGSKLLIHRVAPWLQKSVSLERLRYAYDDPALGPLLNTSFMSQGALFGWAGPAQVTKLGGLQAYATNNKKAVVLEFTRPERTTWRAAPSAEAARASITIYVISPADPAGFVAELNRLPGIGGKDEASAAAAAEAKRVSAARAADLVNRAKKP